MNPMNPMNPVNPNTSEPDEDTLPSSANEAMLTHEFKRELDKVVTEMFKNSLAELPARQSKVLVEFTIKKAKIKKKKIVKKAKQKQAIDPNTVPIYIAELFTGRDIPRDYKSTKAELRSALSHLLSLITKHYANNHTAADHYAVLVAADVLKDIKYYTAAQLHSRYPKSFVRFCNCINESNSIAAIDYADHNGWLFNRDGDITYITPDDQLEWTVEQLEKFNPKGFLKAVSAYYSTNGSKSKSLRRIAKENSWKFRPDGQRIVRG